MAVKRVVATSFWTDGMVVDLFSPEDRYFMLYLLTNPHSTQLGIYHLSPKLAAFEMGYSLEAVKVLIERFEKKYELVFWDEKEQEIAIKNYLCHSIVKGGKPVYDLLTKELKDVKSKDLKAKAIKHLLSKELDNGTVQKFVHDNKHIVTTSIEDSIDNVNVDENDNDNSSAYRGTNRDTNRTDYSPLDDLQYTLGWLPTEFQAKFLVDLYQEVGEYAFHKALEKAARKNAKDLNYIESAARGIASGNDFDDKPKNSGALDFDKALKEM